MVAVLLVGSALSGFGLVLLSGSGQVGALLAWAVLRSPVVPVTLLILMETPGVGATRMGAAAGLFFAVAEIGGFGGPLLLGAVRDATGELGAGILIVSALVAAMALLMPLIHEDRGSLGADAQPARSSTNPVP